MPSSADPARPPDSFASELTRTDSDASAITLDFSKDAWLPCDEAMQQGKSTEWTDEKHSMYLDYLEASFVDDLYHSMHLGGLGVKKNSRRPYTSDKFVVREDRGRKKINDERNEPLFDSTADSHVVMERPLIHHFKYPGKGCSVACLDSQEHVVLRENKMHSNGKLACLYESARSLEQKPVDRKCHWDIVGSAAEFSDQNFVEDNPGGNPSRKSMSKRLKMAASDGSGNDQIMLPENFHARGVSIGNNMFCTKEEGRNALLSDHPEDFVCPKSDIPIF
ncbi:uncharacterized protein LOC21410139 isoform X1 [Morus notabilis]|uniref:uncharacterized protein LOC21410139 isoform X1 n=1 Tax=Morus notabilis TaxID=981085 RepID=UPI000CED6F5F|nr:uncharacterized protein LOC21410139 isoform X1 [Morus notabilis]